MWRLFGSAGDGGRTCKNVRAPHSVRVCEKRQGLGWGMYMILVRASEIETLTPIRERRLCIHRGVFEVLGPSNVTSLSKSPFKVQGYYLTRWGFDVDSGWS